MPQGERYRLDLWQANKLQLIESGLKAKNVEVSAICTKCNNKLFYSYRNEAGNTVRHGAFIMLR